MCQFCVEHGDGKKWYLQAQNYSDDLRSIRSGGLAQLELVKRFPQPIRSLVLDRASRRQRKVHFGQAVPLEDCERIFDITTSIVRLPCACRRFAGTREDGYCIMLTTSPAIDLLEEGFRDYVDGPDVTDFQQLAKPGAVELLRTFEDQGLMHSVWTFVTPFIWAICNCNLASGCMAVRVTREYDFKVMWKGEYVAQVDPELCDGCAKCVRHCPVDAMDRDKASKKAAVRMMDCYGCGICRVACEQGAISLTDRAAVPAAASVW